MVLCGTVSECQNAATLAVSCLFDAKLSSPVRASLTRLCTDNETQSLGLDCRVGKTFSARPVWLPQNARARARTHAICHAMRLGAFSGLNLKSDSKSYSKAVARNT